MYQTTLSSFEFITELYLDTPQLIVWVMTVSSMAMATSCRHYLHECINCVFESTQIHMNSKPGGSMCDYKRFQIQIFCIFTNTKSGNINCNQFCGVRTNPFEIVQS